MADPAGAARLPLSNPHPGFIAKSQNHRLTFSCLALHYVQDVLAEREYQERQKAGMEETTMTSHEMQHMHGEPMGSARPPTLGQHNQMMVGEQTIYLSHLPMFMFDPASHEHNFQVILEVRLGGPGNPQATYADDRRNHPEVRMYTMSPEPFEMVELDPQDPRRAALTGDIFRGHLERGGQPIIRATTAEVVRIVYFHEFDPDARPLDALEYLLFGEVPDLFLAHLITRPPDFDQILGVMIDGAALAADDLKQGVRVRIPGRANTAHTRIKTGERVSAEAELPGAQVGQSLALELEAVTEFYFEEGELRLPMTMRPTPEEIEAGF
jgi:hypothetical protein